MDLRPTSGTVTRLRGKKDLVHGHAWRGHLRPGSSGRGPGRRASTSGASAHWLREPSRTDPNGPPDRPVIVDPCRTLGLRGPQCLCLKDPRCNPDHPQWHPLTRAGADLSQAFRCPLPKNELRRLNEEESRLKADGDGSARRHVRTPDRSSFAQPHPGPPRGVVSGTHRRGMPASARVRRALTMAPPKWPLLDPVAETAPPRRSRSPSRQPSSPGPARHGGIVHDLRLRADGTAVSHVVSH